jgi:NAD(P)-dependent dehydrogenase (short-subunit alcohol dehydrogenase family)
MAKIFISGSSTGLGLMTGRLLVEQGHQVVLHGRSGARSRDAHLQLPALTRIGANVGIIRSPNRASILPDQSSPGSVWLRAG